MPYLNKIAILCFALLVMQGCKKEKTYIGPDKMPFDYMYMQRAYPHNQLNKQLFEEGKKIYWDHLSNAKIDNEWEPEGPYNIGGRITDIARHPSNPQEYYIGTSVGGIFKTTNDGNDWTAIFDEIGSPSIGNLAISRSNPEILYAGTGEANGSATSGAFFGTGIYKTIDGGETWTNVGLTDSDHIGRIHVDHNDPNLVYAAATGRLYGKNNERGLYRTKDGGESWDQLLFISDSTACIDLAVHPTDSNILFAVMWERTRAPWQRDYGGESSGIYRSTDAGENWEKLEGGLPISDDDTGRIGIAISESNPDIIYSVYTTNSITNVYDGVYKSFDGGDTWERYDEGVGGVFSTFGWFFGNIRVSPHDPDLVFLLGVRLWRSVDGAKTFESLGGMHVDQHALEFDLNDPDNILFGNDGGIYISNSGSAAFSKISYLPITQFYEITVDPSNPERIFGGTQDNNTVRTTTGEIDDYQGILGGDGFHVIVDPRDNGLVYAESQFGNLNKSTDGGDSFSRALEGIGDNDRHSWNTPIFISPVNPNFIYYGTEKLYRSFQAELWEAISDDLSKGQHPSGSTSFATISTIAGSYQDFEKLYVGTDDGNVWVLQNGQWNLISENLPNRHVSSIAVNPDDDNIVIVTLSGFGYVDYQPHILISYDSGQNWEDISSNLPEVPINDVVIDPQNTDVLFIATDLGCWYSIDLGASWNVLGKSLPLTIANDLELHNPTRRLYVGTFGRSIWSLDVEDDIFSSTTDAEFSQGIDIYPNPAKDFIKINTDELQNDFRILIYDAAGKLKLEKSNQNEIDIRNLISGSYTVQVLNKNGIKAQKLIVI